MDVKYTHTHSARLKGQEIGYYVTECEVPVEGRAYTRFGVAIRMSGGDEGELLDIYGDKSRAAALADTLCRCLVTPTTLKDVVEDTLYKEETVYI